MRFLIFPFVILSTALLAHSAAVVKPNTRVAEAHSRYARTLAIDDDVLHSKRHPDDLVARQLPDLSQLANILNSIQSSLAGVQQITSQGNVDIVNSLLKSLNTVAGDTTANIPGILSGVQGITSQQNVNSINTLLKTVTGLLDDSTVNDIKGIVGGAAKLLDEGGNLLTPATIQSLQGVLTGASNLLSPQNVNHLTDVINDVSPLVDSVTKVLSVLISAIMAPPPPN